MYVNAKITGSGTRNLVNLDLSIGMKLDSRRTQLSVGNVVVLNSATEEDLESRYQDICDALVEGNVNVYDCNKDIGYWKPTAPKRAPAAAKKAPATK